MAVSPRTVRWPSVSIPLTDELAQASAKRPPLQANRPAGTPFSDDAPQGGLLVGMRLAKGKNWGGALQAVQPIYRVGDRLTLGKRHGTAGGEEHELIAKPGYAIGAVQARAGLVLNAVRSVFYRIDGQRLDPKDHYQSEWIGSDGGGRFDLDPQGDPIVSVFGSYQQDLISLGIEPAAQISAPASAPLGASDETSTSTAPFRVWQSADGRSQVEARMLDTDGVQVQLERRDGKRISVPLSSLSGTDLEFVREAQPAR